MFTTSITRWARHSGRAWTKLDANRCCVVNRGLFGYDLPLLADIDLLACCGLPCLYEAAKTEVQGWNHWSGCFAIRQWLGVVVVQGADQWSVRRDCQWGNRRYEGQRGADLSEMSRIAWAKIFEGKNRRDQLSHGDADRARLSYRRKKHSGEVEAA